MGDARRFFFFGLLSDREMLELVIGRPAPGRPFPRARLAGFRLVQLRGDTYPVLVAAPGAWVPGIVVEGLNEADLDRIHFFESLEYAPIRVEVEVRGAGVIEAQAFTATQDTALDKEEWRFDDWLVRHKANDLRETELWMALYGYLDIAKADRLWDEALAEGRPLEDMVRDVCRGRLRAGS